MLVLTRQNSGTAQTVTPTGLAAVTTPSPSASQSAAIAALRAKFAQATYRPWSLPRNLNTATVAAGLSEAGHFADLADVDSENFQKKVPSTNWEAQQQVAPRLDQAFSRIWLLAESLRHQPRPLAAGDRALQTRLFKAIVYYGALEQQRPNIGARFHTSCFAIPLAAVNAYFSCFPEMTAVEDGSEQDELTVQAHKMLLALGYQTWTVPARGDVTDANPVSVERFRKHVWWVGGNALAYRPVFAVALTRRSPQMLDVLSQVASGAISGTSAATEQTSFWTEGMTVDGSGWAHGRQNQPFAYPRDGTDAALDILQQLQGTPWEKPLDATQIGVLFNYIRGSSWFYFKGYNPPVIYRSNMVYSELGPRSLGTSGIAAKLLSTWRGQLTPAQATELQSLAVLSGEKGTFPVTVERGNYRGTRYFWNQDALAAKSDSYYMLVNMASHRKDGLESTVSPAAGYNLFTNDGHTLFYRDGKEYSEAMGAWNLTALPGVTARQGEAALHPVTNWRGYNSLSNFAGGVTRGENGCAGFIFEKHNASCPQHVNDRCGADDPNSTIYGVRAHKAWFVLGNSMLALGTGITNLQPELSGEIWTTINQTSWRTAVTARDATGQVQQAPVPDGTSREWTLLDKNGHKAPVISQDGFTYTILPQYTTGEVKASVERRPTKWDKLATGNKSKKTPAQADVFQLWIDHGARPQGASYAYLVSATDEVQLPAQPPLEVLSNTQAVQAARSADGRILQAVFYETTGSLHFDGHRIAVNTPCVLMIEKSADSSWIVTINDPEQLPGKKAVQLLTDAPLTGPAVSPVTDGRQVLTVPLPEAPLLGKPVSVQVGLRDGLRR